MTDIPQDSKPKAFISYSWSSPEHEEWVLKLATELRDSGVDAILDKWDLKEGHDPNAFMERMVTDADVKKVILVCDKEYKEKADSRQGGVGTEAQIISAGIYNKVQQEKFVAVLAERDENGKPYLPAYYASRIYIDLSTDQLYADNFDRVLRWIFGKPVYEKPEIGPAPQFLYEPSEMSLGTSTRFRRALQDIANHRPSAEGDLREYFQTLTTNIEKFRIQDTNAGNFDDKILENINQFTPYRNEAIQIFAAMARFKNPQLNQPLHQFFEDLTAYLPAPDDMYARPSDARLDNFKFIIHDLFLNAIAVFLKCEGFAVVNHLLSRRYKMAAAEGLEPMNMRHFSVLNNPLPFLDYRNERLKPNRRMLHGELLKERIDGKEIKLGDLLQADFVLFVRSLVDSATDQDAAEWYPETLIYMSRTGVFEVFLRSESTSYFNQLKVILGVDQKDRLQSIPQDGDRTLRRVIRYNLMTDVVLDWMNLDKIATRP